jgi:hypothetical protein
MRPLNWALGSYVLVYWLAYLVVTGVSSSHCGAGPWPRSGLPVISKASSGR